MHFWRETLLRKMAQAPNHIWSFSPSRHLLFLRYIGILRLICGFLLLLLLSSAFLGMQERRGRKRGREGGGRQIRAGKGEIFFSSKFCAALSWHLLPPVDIFCFRRHRRRPKVGKAAAAVAGCCCWLLLLLLRRELEQGRNQLCLPLSFFPLHVFPIPVPNMDVDRFSPPSSSASPLPCCWNSSKKMQHTHTNFFSRKKICSKAFNCVPFPPSPLNTS